MGGLLNSPASFVKTVQAIYEIIVVTRSVQTNGQSKRIMPLPTLSSGEGLITRRS